MFSEKKGKNIIETGNKQNRISNGTKIIGDISSKGGFRIDGEIEGNVNTPSKVVIGKLGYLNGSLTCENADIEGKIEGTLHVSGILTLRSSAHIEGEVIAGKLAVEPGATFNATCVMKGSLKNKEVKIGTPSLLESEKKKLQNHPFDRSQRAQSRNVGTKEEQQN